MNKLRILADQGIINIDELNPEQRRRLEHLLTDEDVASLTSLNDRTKLDGTLGPLAANTRQTGG